MHFSFLFAVALRMLRFTGRFWVWAKEDAGVMNPRGGREGMG